MTGHRTNGSEGNTLGDEMVLRNDCRQNLICSVNYGLVASWRSFAVRAWLCLCLELISPAQQVGGGSCRSLCRQAGQSSPLNTHLDKSQFRLFYKTLKSDGRWSKYYMSAMTVPCCCWVTFSSLEIKNVHSHKLERRLVLSFYSKEDSCSMEGVKKSAFCFTKAITHPKSSTWRSLM